MSYEMICENLEIVIYLNFSTLNEKNVTMKNSTLSKTLIFWSICIMVCFAIVPIYSITGQKVKTLVNDHLSAGYHQVQWNGTNNFGSEIASGLYILELKSGSDHVMKKLMFAK